MKEGDLFMLGEMLCRSQTIALHHRFFRMLFIIALGRRHHLYVPCFVLSDVNYYVYEGLFTLNSNSFHQQKQDLFKAVLKCEQSFCGLVDELLLLK